MKVQILVLSMLTALAATTIAPPAEAQFSRDRERDRKSQKKAKKSENKPAMFPLATRESPEAKVSAKGSSRLQKVVDLNDADKTTEAIVAADAVISDSKASDYEKAFAWQAKGFALYDLDRNQEAIEALDRSLELNALPNDTHYQIMVQIAQMQIIEEDYAAGLAMLDRFLAETKTDEPKYHAVRANALYRMERFAEAGDAIDRAIAGSDKPESSWVQLQMAARLDSGDTAGASAAAQKVLAQSPDDIVAYRNLAAMYQQGDDIKQAAATLDQARQRGLLEEDDYIRLFQLYHFEEQEAQAIAVINDGLTKGTVKPGLSAYKSLGEAHYFADDLAAAADNYAKAEPFATDGEVALMLARIYGEMERWRDIKPAAQKAIEKGVKRAGDAWMLIGAAEIELGNEAGAVAAYRKAAAFPESKKSAEGWLKAAGKR